MPSIVLEIRSSVKQRLLKNLSSTRCCSLEQSGSYGSGTDFAGPVEPLAR
jgi:hypothetical protein